MKTTELLLLVATAAISAHVVSAVCDLSVGDTVPIPGVCTPTNVLAGLQAHSADCTFASIGQTEESILEACDEAAIPFGDITDPHHYQHDKNFMDGAGNWNTENEADNPLDFSASRLIRFQANVGGAERIDWPKYDALKNYSMITDTGIPDETREPYMSNFNMTESCDLRTVMCCMVDSRKDVLVKNTDLCYHNIEDSMRSSHLRKGFAVYDPVNTNAYCVGFSWEDDPESISNLYKGNALYEASYGTFFEYGFRKNVPGAPMCGCIETMPVVTKADCVKVSVDNVAHELTVHAEDHIEIEQTSGTVNYEECQNLRTNFETAGMGTAEEYNELKTKHLPTECGEHSDGNPVKDFMNKRFLVQGETDQWVKPNSTEWEPLYGRGLSYVPRIQPYDLIAEDEFFRQKLAASRYPDIVYRHCETCHPSHQRIYYRRLTPIPDTEIEGFNYLDLFLSSWTNMNNTRGVDFNLYSDLQDAIDDNVENAWTYCNYNAWGQGFPRDCGPDGWVPCQWNTHYRKNICSNVEYTAISHAFYVAKPL